METKTPREFFEKDAPLRFKPEKVRGVEVTAQLNITGVENGNWTVVIKDQKLQITEGISPAPAITLQMNDKDFMDIVNGKMSAEKAFFSGKVQFNGNIALALKLKDSGFL
jgi:putative sterol carrier protein